MRLRTAAALLAALPLIPACVSLSGTGSTTEPSNARTLPTSTTTTTDPDDPIRPPEPTEPPDGGQEAAGLPPVLLASPDGLFLITGDFLPARLLDGPVAIAVEDTRGGVVFQRAEFAAGRSSILNLRPDDPEPRTVVSVPAEAALQLHGVTPGPGDAPSIWFSRWEGTTPETVTQTILRRPLDDPATEELERGSGWERSSRLRPTPELVLIEWADADRRGLQFRDVDWSEVVVGANPYPPAGERRCSECPRSATLADDAQRAAWLEAVTVGDDRSDDVVVVDLAGRAELSRWSLGADAGLEAELDLHGDHVLINTWDPDNEQWYPPLVLDLTNGNIELVDSPGRGRLVRVDAAGGGLAVP